MVKLKSFDDYLDSIYYNPESEGSYSGAEKIWGALKNRADRPRGLRIKDVREWLKRQDTQAIHLPPKKRVETESIIVEYMDRQWDSDTIDMQQFSKHNNGVKHLLVAIDLFSRYLWVRPMKSKSAKETAEALENIFNEGRVCEIFRSDAGGEFKNNIVKRLLDRNSILHITAYGQHKAAYAERVNRTIQDRIHKHFYNNQTYKYIDILSSLVSSYNATVHSVTGIPPADVTPENSAELYDRVYIPILNKRAGQTLKHSFETGDLVRLSLQRSKFARGYEEKWTEEIFKITQTLPSHPPRYKIEDLAGEIIKGSFYGEELLKTPNQNPDDIVYKIEKIIRKKKVRNEQYSLVKWLSYPDKFNSWLPSSQIGEYKNK